MAGEDEYSWSTTAASNGNADSSIDWTEGMARAQVNNSARSGMAARAKQRNLSNGSIQTGGSGNAQTFTSGVGYTSIPSRLRVTLTAGFTNTGATTLNMDGIGAQSIVTARGSALAGGELNAGGHFEVIWNGSNWLLLNSPYSNVVRTGDTMTGDLTVGGNTLTSGTIPLTCTGNAGGALVQTNNASRTWRFGVDASGNFVLKDQTGGTFPLTFDISTNRTTFTTCVPYIATNGIVYSGVGGANQIGFRWGAITPGYVDVIVDGSVSYALASASDQRIKQDIRPSTFDCLDAIIKVPVHEFRWKDHNETGNPQPAAGDVPLIPAGLVAQHLHKYLPHCVVKGDDAIMMSGNREGQEAYRIWDIDKNNMLGTLVGAIQQLNAKVDELTARLGAREVI